MMDPEIVCVEVTGKTSTGKTAILMEIKSALEAKGLCVACPDRTLRHVDEKGIDEFQFCERPKLDKTIIVLSEQNLAR